jgi:hypothetical protein
VKKRSASVPGRRNRLPHHWEHWTCIGGAGGFACGLCFFHTFSATRPANSDANRALLNVPFDARFETLFLAYIAGLSGFGLVPQSVLQIPGSHRRLDRLTHLISTCQYSFHDLSRVELDLKRPRVPRFNMPFELGLAVGWEKHGGQPHRWYAFESRPYRALKSLSDLNGTGFYIHGNRTVGVFRCLSNALARGEHHPTVRQLQGIYHDLREDARTIKNDLAAKSLFDTRPFLDLAVTARRIARDRIPTLRQT